jgi:hypothetical protein
MINSDAMPVDSILQKIAKACINVDFNKRERESRISPHIFREWHMPYRKIDLQSTIANLTKNVQQATGHARKCLGHVGEINPFFYRRMTEKVTKYEKRFDNAFGLPITAPCAYAKENIKLLGSSNVHMLY